MKKLALRIVVALGVAVMLVLATVIGIRLFADGPIAMIPGGPMSGSIASGDFPGFGEQPNAFVELQVEGWRPSSRTVLAFLHAGDLYVPSVQASKKWWPQQVLESPEVIVRYRGLLYPRRATRITDPALVMDLRKAIADAETVVAPQEMLGAETTWFFKLEPMAN